MTTSLSNFDRSALPLPQHFYEDECGKLSRPSRGWARSRCPLHGGDNPTAFSVNLATGGFFCHSCGESGGDVVSFTQKRYGLSFPDACKKLGAWNDQRIDSGTDARLAREKRARDEKRKAEEQRAIEQRKERIAARDFLHALDRLEADTFSQLCALEHESPGMDSVEKDSCIEILSRLQDQIRTADSDYRRLAGL